MKIARRPSWKSRLVIILVILTAIGVGFLSQFQPFGQLLIGLYGIAVIVSRMGSRTTFILALLALAVIPVAIVGGRQTVATNFATYAFLLFIVGGVQIGVGLWAESKKILAQRRDESRE